MILLKNLRKDGNLIPNRRIDIGEGLYLGGYHKGDQAALVRYLNDISIYKNTLNIPHPYELKDANWWINHIADEQLKLRLQPNWTIRHETDGLIGGIGMVIHGTGLEAQQEIGYWLAKPYRNQGIMTAAIISLTDHCFKKYKRIQAISAHIFKDNAASISTIKKAGFTMVRLIDNHYQKGDHFLDAYEFIKERSKK